VTDQRRPSVMSVLSDYGRRIRVLEALRPTSTPSTAQFDIKLFSDEDFCAVAYPAFVFAVPVDIDGWSLVRAEGFVSSPPTDTNIIVSIGVIPAEEYMTDDHIQIDVGDSTSYTSASPSSIVTNGYEVVTGGDLIWVMVEQADDDEADTGLGVILDFSAP
jgi:hypothetical protein